MVGAGHGLYRDVSECADGFGVDNDTVVTAILLVVIAIVLFAGFGKTMGILLEILEELRRSRR